MRLSDLTHPYLLHGLSSSELDEIACLIRVLHLQVVSTSGGHLGPGLGDVIGPNGNYSNLPNFSKLSLSLGMLLGRLELFAVLVLFFPSFWKN